MAIHFFENVVFEKKMLVIHIWASPYLLACSKSLTFKLAKKRGKMLKNDTKQIEIKFKDTQTRGWL